MMPSPLMELSRVVVSPWPVAVDLEIVPGDCVAFLAGESAGKSRLARVMAGLLSPESGRVVWHGEPGGIGMVFRVPDLRFLCATPREEVALTPAARGVRGEALRERVEESLALAGVDGALLDREWIGLSASERYRVAVASVLAARPGLMILDEPGNMLSDAGEQALADSLRQFSRIHGTAMVFFTSRVARAERFASSIIEKKNFF
ncbi:MAG: energy-coupling factor ABC transporter ATP-binding protein [Magnetococcales bacterium]|nr:energy-coupling factor ABC transporter ATP-binding protein [Magnetococcales bacterium]